MSVPGITAMDAISNVSLQIPHGSQVAIVGPNGAGKSTLFKVLVGLLPVRKGSIRIHANRSAGIAIALPIYHSAKRSIGSSR